MKRDYTAVDRFLEATETIELVKQSLIELSEKKIDSDVRKRLDNIVFVLSSAQDVLNEFEEDVQNDNVLIFNPNN